MSDKTLLDVDDTILTKKLMLAENKEEQEINEMLKQFDSKPFIIIQPSPGACVKAKTENGDKVFVNICTTSKIPPPEDISDVRLLELLNEDTPAFSIPMSIGNERLEKDKNGILCLTYDVAINEQYYQKCQKSKTFWVFTITVVLNGVSNKFEKTINTEEYVILKNRKVVGKLQQHRIEDREARKLPPPSNKPLIEEVSSQASNQYSTKKDATDVTLDKILKYVILQEPANENPKRLIGLYEIPTGIDSKQITVFVNTDRIVVSIEKKGLHDVIIPYDIDVKNVEALLDKDMRVLRLNMPVVQI